MWLYRQLFRTWQFWLGAPMLVIGLTTIVLSNWLIGPLATEWNYGHLVLALGFIFGIGGTMLILKAYDVVASQQPLRSDRVRTYKIDK